MRENEDTISFEDVSVEPGAVVERASHGEVLANARNIKQARHRAHRFIGQLNDGEFAYLRRNTRVDGAE